MNQSTTQQQRPDAVVWVDERHAIVAQRDVAGGISTVEIRRANQNEERYIGHVVHEIGGHEHVMIVGTQPLRLAVERRFVAVGHRPDRLMALPAARSVGERIVAGMDGLAA
ncbi:MAG TPA: hypothetical protein VHR16_05100 [Candidatus Limnocylindrales bacterium]|jgi:hypothetical protein|nr:hypothetical protein [Candidatus Limnocylindrales bacterium]